MMKWPGVFPGTVVFLCFCAACGLVYAGANHDAAMGIVHQGEAISGTGNLDAAMAEYARVEELYPEEYEPIAWARYRTSECLVAGWRWPEALATVRWVWDRIEDGTITNPDARFWGAYQFARCVERVGDKWFLAQVARKALDTYETFAEPSAGMEEAAGWLNYWRARHFIGKDQYVWGREAGEAAWEIGKKVKNGTLAAWARLAMADALRGEGNLLLARQMLDECGDNYAPHEDDTYRLYLQTSQAEAKLALGLAQDTRQIVMNVLQQEIGEPALRIRAALVYADDAIRRGATMEVLGPLAVIRSSLRHVPLWADQADERWQRIRGRVQPDTFSTALAELASGTAVSSCEHAALKLAQAEQCLAEGQTADASLFLDEAEGLAEDERYEVSLRLLRAQSVSDTTPEAEQQETQALIAEKSDSPTLVEHLLRRIRGKIAGGVEGATAYAVWLDARQDVLPRNTYLIEKGRCLRRNRGLPGALAVAEEVLASTDPWNRLEAHVDKIIVLYLLGRDAEAEAAVEAFLADTPDASQRNYGLFRAGDAVRDHYLEGSLALLDRVIASSERGVWWQEAMMDKGYLLMAARRSEEAKTVLEELASHAPLEGNGGESVGVGLVLLAKVHEFEYGDGQTAETYYHTVLDASESMRFAQSYAYREYVNTLRWRDDPEGMLAVCERGLRELPYTAEVDRGLLRLWKCDARFRLGDHDGAIASAQALLEQQIPVRVRLAVENWLSRVIPEPE